MTLKIPIQEKAKTVGSLRFCGNDSDEKEMVMDEKIYVAVTGKDLESKASLVWAIQKIGGKEFCIVYVETDPCSWKEKEKVHKNLDKYLKICKQMKVNAEKIYIEMDSVEKGILQLISQRGVTKLVMGAAADRRYTMNMSNLKSTKAINIYREAPATCQIWFTCRGYQICKREATRRRDNLYPASAPPIPLSQSNTTRGKESVPNTTRGKESVTNTTSGKESVPSSSIVKDDDRIKVALAEAEISRREARGKESVPNTTRGKESVTNTTKGKESVPSSSIVKDDDRIKVSLVEAESSRREARIEVSKRVEAEKTAIDAIKRAKQSEKAYNDELKQREKTENALKIALEELEKMRSELETRMTESNTRIRKLRATNNLSMEALRRLREEKEELKIKLGKLSKMKSNRKSDEPPQYFICPITQDVMEDPHVAADGFTYEGEAIREWFRGHETSPMTNKRLPHTSLVPNLALRSAIQVWIQDSTS